MYYEILVRIWTSPMVSRALVDERLGRLEQFLQDYPPESVMAHVALERLPTTDELYEVRTNSDCPGTGFTPTPRVAPGLRPGRGG